MNHEKKTGSELLPAEAEKSVRTEGEPADEQPQALPPAELPEDLPAAYQKLLTEKEELYERLLRKQAELENFRKRSQKEREDFLQHASADLLRSLLPVLDGIERALRQRDPNVPASFYQGVELIYQDLFGVLTRAGVTRIETEGKLFDPHVHQAVETVEAEGHRD